ncbi:MAG: hypothetical protein PWP65_1249 [Clostridia bacterium]|nr:hypothetical protein [Clostridia bacterium]
MSITVSRENCNGCGLCVELCPLDCLRLDEENHPYLKYDECWYCGTCETECPLGAIKITLPFLVR